MKQLVILLSFIQFFSLGGLAQTETVFFDDFTDDRNDWLGSPNEKRSYRYSNGKLYFSTTSSWVNSKAINIDESKDFMIETQITKVGGVNNKGFGLVYGRFNSTNEYEFNISGNGMYQIIKWDNGKFENLIKWRASDKINKWIGGTNKLTIKKIGSYLKYYINDSYITQLPAHRFFDKYFGFVVYNQQEIAIDYLKVAYLSGSNNNKQIQKKQIDDNNNISDYNGIEVLHEEFSDNRKGWATQNSDGAEFDIYGGKYYFEHLRESSAWTTYNTVSLDETKDFVIESKIKKLTGEHSNGYGILWGVYDINNKFDFTISPNGYFRIINWHEGEAILLKKWTKTDYVNQGNGVSNILKIEKIGRKMKFYVNGNLVTTLPFKQFYGNYMGFILYQDQKIAVDYLRVDYIERKVYNTPPQITITEPSLSRGFNIVPAQTVRVAGQAKDSDGIASVMINGKRASLRSGGYFSMEVPITVGKNTITVKARDNKNKSNSRTFEVTRKTQQTIQKRLALIVGNANYTHGGSLQNPTNDARAMKTTLEGLGFEVIKHENCDQKTLKRAMDDFGRKLENYDVGLFFYAGHGVQVDGNNYLIPTDAKLEAKNDVEYDCVKAGRILGKMEDAGTKTNIVILDACRDNPFERSWSRSTQGKGLAFMNAPSGSLVAYATSPGNVASDGEGSNGLYTASLLKHIKTEGITIEQLFKRVRATVVNQSNGKQTPWESTSLTGDFYFNN